MRRRPVRSTRSLLSLLATARGGDESAMAEILQRFHPLIRKLSRNLAETDREDLEQELRLHLLQILRAYRPSIRSDRPDRLDQLERTNVR